MCWYRKRVHRILRYLQHIHLHLLDNTKPYTLSEFTIYQLTSYSYNPRYIRDDEVLKHNKSSATYLHLLGCFKYLLSFVVVKISKANRLYKCREQDKLQMLPAHVNPSPKYPSVQEQVKFPGVLVQFAYSLQFPLFTSHSSTSVSQYNAVHITVCFCPRDAMLTRVLAVIVCPSVRLSVRLSHAGIVSKRLNVTMPRDSKGTLAFCCRSRWWTTPHFPWNLRF